MRQAVNRWASTRDTSRHNSGSGAPDSQVPRRVYTVSSGTSAGTGASDQSLLSLMSDAEELSESLRQGYDTNRQNGDVYCSDLSRLSEATPHFNSEGWRISRQNRTFRHCSSYPPMLYVPVSLSDMDIPRVSQAFVGGRMPILSYVDSHSGGALATCSICLDLQSEGAQLVFQALSRCVPASAEEEHPPQGFSSSEIYKNLAATAAMAAAAHNNGAGGSGAGPSGQAHAHSVSMGSGSGPAGRNYRTATTTSAVVGGKPAGVGTSTGSTVGGSIFAQMKALANSTFGAALDADKTEPALTSAAPCRRILVTLKDVTASPGPEWHVVDARTGPWPLVSNIGAIDQALRRLELLCQGINESKYLSQLEDTAWLQQLCGLLYWAEYLAGLIRNESAVVVLSMEESHDVTAQLSALIQLLLDPYYRTLEGFMVLVKREWLALGHRFASRAGIAARAIPENSSAEGSNSCLVFAQFLDAVYQLQLQHPTAFEFNSTYLALLAHHSVACR